MSELNIQAYDPAFVIVISSSVWGGRSRAVTACTDIEKVRELCALKEDDNLTCTTLLSAISSQTDPKKLDEDFEDKIEYYFTEYVEHDEDEEIIIPVFTPQEMLDPTNVELLSSILEMYVETGYTNEPLQEYLESHGIPVLFCS